MRNIIRAAFVVTTLATSTLALADAPAPTKPPATGKDKTPPAPVTKPTDTKPAPPTTTKPTDTTKKPAPKPGNTKGALNGY